MQRCKLKVLVPSVIEFRVREGEEESAEELIEKIGEGYAPTWIEELIKRGLRFDQADVDEFVITGLEPQPDEELNFDY